MTTDTQIMSVMLYGKVNNLAGHTMENLIQPKNTDAWLKAQIIAYSVILYGCEICTEATHYHTINVKPYWSRKLTKLGMYGDHIFYQWEHK
jgi:hypothetical protein